MTAATPITYPRFAPRRGGVRSAHWWGKAWQRAVEEASYGEAELRRARAFVRAGAVGTVTVESGGALAAVEHGDDVHTVTISTAPLSAEGRAMLVELVAAASGRVGSLLAGDLPHELVEELEDSGIEVLPYGGEFESVCTCDPWLPPCAHALAVLLQLGRLVDADPFVLLGLRGMPRDDLLAALHEHTASVTPTQQPADDEEDLQVALLAVREAAALVAALEGR